MSEFSDKTDQELANEFRLVFNKLSTMQDELDRREFTTDLRTKVESRYTVAVKANQINLIGIIKNVKLI